MIFEETISLAKRWIEASKRMGVDTSETVRLNRILKDPIGKACLVALLDRSFRAQSSTRAFEQIDSVFKEYGIPRSFLLLEKLCLRGLLKVGQVFPGVAVCLFRAKLRWDTRHLILALDSNHLTRYLQKKYNAGFYVNVNLIAEDVLGKEEACQRLADYIHLLEHPDIHYVSVKISSIVAHFPPLGFESSVEKICVCLTSLFRQAQKTHPHKFINLDMESYNDLRLTVVSFMKTLDQPEFRSLSAGIVLQAYIPESLLYLQELCQWAKDRCLNGGAPIKVRLVKGANLEMERVRSERENLKSPVYSKKVEVDANFKALFHYMLDDNRMQSVHIGVASQNVFELAYVWQHIQKHQLEPYFTFELLEGMSNEIAAYLNRYVHRTLLYTPIVKSTHFYYALAYLFRRLDENTGNENYLNYAAYLPQHRDYWQKLVTSFSDSLTLIEEKRVDNNPIRNQDRAMDVDRMSPYSVLFKNTDTTDFYLKANLEWAKTIRSRWQGVSVARYKNHSWEEIEAMMTTAENDADGWALLESEKRHDILLKLATELNKRRGELIGSAASETGKLFFESDIEVTEAIDFALYYPYSVTTLMLPETVSMTARGVVLVIAPWNFPIAIPLGGIVAALATGNTVLLKAAPESVATAYVLMDALKSAGVGSSTVQLIVCDDTNTLNQLTSSDRIDSIVFTGSTQTGRFIKKQAPCTPVAAETGGKNTLYVSDVCDKDLAIRGILQSAFGHAGQKCSACSIVLLHTDLYRDGVFLKHLKDAAESLHLGNPWDFSAEMGPIIHPPSEVLKQALNLEEDEAWLLAPKIDDQNPTFFSPCIKINVSRGSYTFTTELFAPLLSIVEVSSIEDAIDTANSLPYGLTSGIFSLDPREHRMWKDRVVAGNIYINRSITGAIVQRQPFGGFKSSSLGIGIKAGGPNYITQFLRYKNEIKPSIDSIIMEYQQQMDSFFSRSVDVSKLYGEENILRYIPNMNMVYRIAPTDSIESVRLICHAMAICNVSMVISIDMQVDSVVWDILSLFPQATIIEETEEDLLVRVHSIERLRVSKPVTDLTFRQYIAHTACTLIDHEPIYSGRIELLYYLNEQSISYEYHRYGNVSQYNVSSKNK